MTEMGRSRRAVDGVDGTGDLRVRPDQQKVAVHSGEHQRQRRDHEQVHSYGTDENPVHPRPQPSTAQERQHDGDQQEQPHVPQQQTRCPQEWRLELKKQG